jgi:Carboxypeptidase regulatory-like domain
MNTTDQVGLARTSDGVLHVAWRRRGAAQDLLQTPVAASGKPGGAVPIVTGWASIGSPALVGRGSELAVFFGATQTLTTGDPTYGLDLATSGDAGASWSVRPEAIARGGFAFARTPAAVLTRAGAYLQAWYDENSTVVHPGLDVNVAPVGGYGLGTDQALATGNAGGNAPRVTVAWCTELAAVPGVYAAPVDIASGARSGPVVTLPDTGDCPADTRVALASFRDVPRRADDGEPFFYVAAVSASGRRLRLYVIEGSRIVATRTLAAGTSFKQQVAIAAAPKGRVWVGWRDSDEDALVFRRSDPGAGFDYGAEVTVPLPAGQSLSQLALDAQDDRLDAIATTSDRNNVVSLFATQVLPGLTLKAPTRKGFRVLDADDPVKGATVRVAGRTVTTAGSGYAKLTLPPGAYTAVASKAGYANASVRFTVR